MGELRVVKDLLPPPDKLAFKEENVKITISLKKSSVEFFKKRGTETSYILSENDQAGYRLVRFTISEECLTCHESSFGMADDDEFVKQIWNPFGPESI